MTAAPRLRLPLALAAVVAATLLSGCFGYPAGSARPGDLVQVRYTAHAADGSTVSDAKVALFALGSGTSGLGRDVEQALVGVQRNATVEVQSPAAERAFTGTASLDEELGRDAIDQTYNATSFARQLNTVPVLGFKFRAFGYNATLTSVDRFNVTFQLESMDGTRVPFPQYGVDVVYGTQGTERVRLLEPRTGSVFTIQTQDQNGPDLAPGTYKVLGLSGGKVRFATSPGTDAALVGRDLHFVVTLLDVQPGQPPAIPSGQYGVRASPQVLGDVSPFIRHDEAAAQTTATAR